VDRKWPEASGMWPVGQLASWLLGLNVQELQQLYFSGGISLGYGLEGKSGKGRQSIWIPLICNKILYFGLLPLLCFNIEGITDIAMNSIIK